MATRRTQPKVAGTRSPAAARVAAAAPVPPPPAPATARVSRKQAVVVVHGMGEQRPLETLRSFVEAVFQRDADQTFDDIRDRDVDENGELLNRVWIVPDAVTGSMELRRITTPENVNGVRTDFYEFYYADLLIGTPLEMVTAWFRMLLLRAPWRVPRRAATRVAFMLLWALTLFGGAIALAMLNPEVPPFTGWVEAIVGWIKANQQMLVWISGGLAIALTVLRVGQTKKLADLRLMLPFALGLIAVALLLVPEAIFSASPRLWAAAISGAVAALLAGIIVPYVGDIVRFVRATPQTIAAREAVRTRGLALLRALHAKGLDEDGAGEPTYDRVVLVCHSLGSIVGYDLLARFWEEVGPSPKSGPLPAPVVEALAAVDAFVEREALGKPEFDLAAYQQAQARLHHALAASRSAWRISDFVTMGSPLVHAEFLITQSPAALDQAMEERMFSASPPRPNLPNNSMLYSDRGAQEYPHHAAVFAATRWTNIYDEDWFPLLGDVVSGPVPAVFGRGIADLRVVIRHGPIPILNRLVTHTWYWENTGRNWSNPADHILKLRRALRLF